MQLSQVVVSYFGNQYDWYDLNSYTTTIDTVLTNVFQANLGRSVSLNFFIHLFWITLRISGTGLFMGLKEAALFPLCHISDSSMTLSPSIRIRLTQHSVWICTVESFIHFASSSTRQLSATKVFQQRFSTRITLIHVKHAYNVTCRDIKHISFQSTDSICIKQVALLFWTYVSLHRAKVTLQNTLIISSECYIRMTES